MKSPVTSEETGKTPNTSFRERPSFPVLASETRPHHFCLCPLPASLFISGPLWTRCPIPGPHYLCPHPPGGWALTPSGCWPSAHTALCTGVHTPKYNQFTTSSHSAPHRIVLCLCVRTESYKGKVPKGFSIKHACIHATRYAHCDEEQI